MLFSKPDIFAIINNTLEDFLPGRIEFGSFSIVKLDYVLDKVFIIGPGCTISVTCDTITLSTYDGKTYSSDDLKNIHKHSHKHKQVKENKQVLEILKIVHVICTLFNSTKSIILLEPLLEHERKNGKSAKVLTKLINKHTRISEDAYKSMYCTQARYTASIHTD